MKLVTGDWNSMVPAYGKWAGPGWGGGARTSEVVWTEPPCYNESATVGSGLELSVFA